MRQKCSAYERANMDDLVGNLTKIDDMKAQDGSISKTHFSPRQEQTLSVVLTNTFLNGRPQQTDLQAVSTRTTNKSKPWVSFADALTLVDSAGIADRIAQSVRGVQYSSARAPTGIAMKVSEFQIRKNQSLTNFSSMSRSWARDFASKNKSTAIFEEAVTNRTKIPVSLAPWIKKPTADYDEEAIEVTKPESLFTLNPMLDDLLKTQGEQPVFTSASRIIGSARSSPRGKFSLTRESSRVSTPTNFNIKKEGVRKQESSHLRIRSQRSTSLKKSGEQATRQIDLTTYADKKAKSRMFGSDSVQLLASGGLAPKPTGGSTLRLIASPSVVKPGIIALTALRRTWAVSGSATAPPSPSSRGWLAPVPNAKRVLPTH